MIISEEVYHQAIELTKVINDLDLTTIDESTVDKIFKRLFFDIFFKSTIGVHNSANKFSKYYKKYEDKYFEFSDEIPIDAVNVYFSFLYKSDIYLDEELKLLRNGNITRMLEYYIRYYKNNK